MPIEVVKITGITETEARLLSSNLLGNPLKGVLTDMGKLAQREAKAGAPKHIKIARRTTKIAATVRAIGADAATWEIGRRPGAKMPPIQAIEHWATGKGISPELVFPIARAIKRRGLKGRFYMKHAKSVVEQELPSRMDRMRIEVEREFST